MQLLTLSQLRHHYKHHVQTLLAIMGVALGVAVVNAVDITHYSAKQNLLKTQQQINGQATHRIVGTDRTIDETVYSEMRRTLQSRYPQIALTPIVNLSLPDKDRAKNNWTILGIDLLANTTVSHLGSSLTTTDITEFITQENSVFISVALATQESVDIGEELTLTLEDRQLKVFVAGIFDNTTNAIDRQLIVMDIGNAQTLFNLESQLSSVDVYIPKNQQELVDTVRDKIPENTRFLATEQIVEGQLSLINALGFNLSALSFLSLIIGAFLIFSTVRFSILQRIPSFARLRIQGVTHKELHKLLTKEALCLSVLGVAAGWILGYGLSTLLAPISQRTILNLYSTQTSSQLIFHWPIYAKTALLGTFTTLAGYYFSYKNNKQLELSHTVARIQQEIPHHNSNIKLQYLIALALFIIAFILLNLPLTMSALESDIPLFISYLATCLLASGSLLLIPGILHLCYPIILKSAQLLWKSTGLIALRDCQREASRVLPAIIALSLSVSATNGIAIMIDSFRHSVNHWIDSQLDADIYLRIQHSHVNSTINIENLITQLRSNTSIECLSLTRHAKTFIEDKWLALNAVELPDCVPSSVQFIHADSASTHTQFRTGQLFISEPLARKKHLRISDSLTLHTEQGYQQFQIAGIVRDYGAEHGRIIINRDDYISHWNDTTINSIGIYLNKASSKSDVLQQLNDNLSHTPYLQLLDSEQIREKVIVIFDQTFETTRVLRIIVLIIATIAIISTLIVYQLQRREQLLTLRALGMTIAELRQLFVIQAGFIGACAGLLAIPLGLLIAWLLVAIINPAAFGWTLSFYINPMVSISGFLVAIGAGLLAAIYPCIHFGRNTNIMELGRE